MAFLINQSDIKIYRPIADIPAERINVYIEESQKAELRAVLGEPLYYDFITKYNDSGDPMYTNYQNLLNGTTYTYNNDTIEFFGIKPMLVYYTLARFLTNQPMNITRYGVVMKTNDQSSNASAEQVRMTSNELRGEAVRYQNDLVQFLVEKSTTYPLYDSSDSKPIDETTFRFFGI